MGLSKNNVFTGQTLIIAVTLIEWCTFLYQESQPDKSSWNIAFWVVTTLTTTILYLKIGIVADTTKEYLSRILILLIGATGLYSLTSIFSQTPLPNPDLLDTLLGILLVVSLGKTFQPKKHSSTPATTKRVSARSQRLPNRLLAINILLLFSICALDISRLSMWSGAYIITIGILLTIFIGWSSHSTKALVFQASVLLLSVFLSALILDIYRPGTYINQDKYLHINMGIIFFVFPLCIGKAIRFFSQRKSSDQGYSQPNLKNTGHVLFIATTIMALAIWPLNIIYPGNIYSSTLYLFCILLHVVIAVTPANGKVFLIRIAILSSTAAYGLALSADFNNSIAFTAVSFITTAMLMGIARLFSFILAHIKIEKFIFKKYCNPQNPHSKSISSSALTLQPESSV
ncbi:MAG: hypothetical protein JKY54_10480 [Flavobacteriales bacterium]|nr:hypothetical protein [Flavobacteriales bacterium]